MWDQIRKAAYCTLNLKRATNHLIGSMLSDGLGQGSLQLNSFKTDLDCTIYNLKGL